MKTEKIKFIGGLTATTIIDKYGRESEVYVGYEDVIIVHREPDSAGSTMRRFSREDFELLVDMFR